jgi:hypothetical protein
LCIKPSKRRTSSRNSRWTTQSPCPHQRVRLQHSTRMRTKSPWTRRSTGAWSAPSCTWRQRGRTSIFLCLCTRFQASPKTLHRQAVKWIFRYLRYSPELGLWYSASSSLSLLVFSDANFVGVESIGNRLQVLTSFWDLRLFLGLLANSLV